MDFVISLLKEKKKEIQKDYADTSDYIKIHACKLMTEQIDNAIKTLDYEYYWKHLSEKQVCDKLGVSKRR